MAFRIRNPRPGLRFKPLQSVYTKRTYTNFFVLSIYFRFSQQRAITLVNHSGPFSDGCVRGTLSLSKVFKVISARLQLFPVVLLQ